MQKRGFFIAGTDTAVGKTVVTAGLTALLKKRGIDCGFCKPLQTGVSLNDPLAGDLGFICQVSGMQPKASSLVRYTFKTPVTPAVAAQKEGVAIDKEQIYQLVRQLSDAHDFILVEGVGGLLAPIAHNYSNAELAYAVNLPLLIVARAGLGTIHHTLATVEAAKNRGLIVCGIILNGAKLDGSDISEQSNAQQIEQESGVPVLGMLPHVPDLSVEQRRYAGLLESMEKHLRVDALIEDQPNNLNQLEDDDRQFIWHPFTQMYEYEQVIPLVVERAQGVYLFDIHGKRYLDGVSSLWVNVHGHRRKEIDQSVHAQLGRIAHSTQLGIASRPAIELARKLTQIAPRGLSKVFYSDNGSTAVEVALKMAYQYWKNKGQDRRSFLCFENAYHGDTLGAVAVGGIQLFHDIFAPLLIKTLRVPYPEKVNYLDNFAFILKEKKEQIAAVIVEPLVQGAAGMRMMVPEAMAEIRKLCTDNQVLLIADEVAVGFGRTGKMFACDHDQVTPDFLCLAKGITGGYLPLAATLTTQEVYRAFRAPWVEGKTFFHGHSYTGNQLGCAAALGSLQLFEKEATLEKLQPKITLLQELLADLAKQSYVKQVRQRGFMVGIELASREPQLGAKICRRAQEYGAILRPLQNVLVLMPPLAISQTQLRELVTILKKSLHEILAK